MGAPKGNSYWKFRGKHGRDHTYTPDGLWDEFCQYAEWIEANPLKEEKGFAFQGIVTKEDFSKMRAMTIKGFCLFADIEEQTFRNYRNTDDFFAIITRIENCIYTQKFEGAAAELLNQNIIARELGLIDKQEVRQDVTIHELTTEQRASRIAELKSKLDAI